MINYNSPVFLKNFLKENGFSAQKKFGQNFLVNENVRKSLIENLKIAPFENVWEIGSGLGAMSSEILERGAILTAFEVDHGFCKVLNEVFFDFSQKKKFFLVEGDVLKTLKARFFSILNDENCENPQKNLPKKLFANLPYNIAATILAQMIEENIRFDRAVVTVQKEVGNRMCAKIGSADYSSFSVLCDWAYDVKPIMDLAGKNFWPVPKVFSRALLLTKKSEFPVCKDLHFFPILTRTLFSARRKTIFNNAKSLLPKKIQNSSDFLKDIFLKAQISPESRAENLSTKDFLRLSDVFCEALRSI